MVVAPLRRAYVCAVAHLQVKKHKRNKKRKALRNNTKAHRGGSAA